MTKHILKVGDAMKPIHYLTDVFLTLCNKDTTFVCSKLKWTADKDKVTCKQCLKKMKVEK